MNNTLIVQLELAASVPVGLHILTEFGNGTEKSSASGPAVANPLKFTVVAPLFETVTLSGALVVRTVCEVNVKLVGATVTPDVACAGMDCATTTCGCTEGAGSDGGPFASRKIASYGETMYPDRLPCVALVVVKCPDAFTAYVKLPRD